MDTVIDYAQLAFHTLKNSATEITPKELKSEITNAISTYKDKDDNKAVYTVDYSNGFNKYIKSENYNDKVENASDIEVNGTTMMRIVDGKLVESRTNYSEILSVFND